MTPLLIARALDDARATVARLALSGREAMAASCLAYTPVDADAALEAFRGRAADVLVASPRGADALAEVGVDPAWRVVALAPRSAGALAARGVRVDEVVEGGGRELAAAARPGRVLALTSDRGGDEVLAVRPDAVRVVCYRTAPTAALPAAAHAATAGRYDVLFASPSAVSAFLALAASTVGLRRAFCVGRTTLDAALAIGLPAVLVRLDPLDPLLLEP